MISHSRWIGAIALIAATMARPAAAQRSWDDNGNDASKEWSIVGNWNPNGTPAGEPITIGDLANAANDTTLVDQNFSIDSLTVSNGADVDTSGNELAVNGVTTIGGAGVQILVRPRSVGDQDGLDAEGIVVNADAALRLTGEIGTTAGGIVELESGLFEINAGGEAGGHGTIQLVEAVAGQVMENSGELYVSSRPDVGTIAPGTLTITHAGSGTGTLDLDGDNEAGVVDVDDGSGLFTTALTLVVEVPLADSFSGQMDIGYSDTVNIASPWTMDGDGILNFNGGTGTLAGGTLTVNGAATRVNLNGGTAVFQNNLTFTDGDFRFDSGTVQFDGITTFPDATDFVVNAAAVTIVVNSVVDIGDLSVGADEDLAWDNAQTIVNAAGDLNISVENINLGASNSDRYDATLTINSGNVDVRVSDGVWVLGGVVNINNSAADIPLLSGDTIEIGDESNLIYGEVNVGGSGVSQISAPINFKARTRVNVGAGAVLVTGAVTFESVDGLADAEFTGTGIWRLAGTNTVSETTTINMTGGTVDLDNSEIFALIANNTDVEAPLTINAATVADYGSSKTFLGNTTFSNLTIQNLAANGTLTVNLDDPGGEWTVNSVGILNLENDKVEATLLAGSDVNLNGTVNVTGDVRTDARVDIGGTVNVLMAGEPLRLSGGNLSNDLNTIAGGTINGPGILGADSGSALHGFGTINADVDFDSSSNLKADDGTLTVTGTLLDANAVGTNDDDGVLNVTNAWNTNTVALVDLNGGELAGASITNDGTAGINGDGLVSARVINNTRIDAENNALLLVETAANNNDWDGTTNTGQLNALSGDLEIRDTAAFLFDGTVSALTGRTVFANGFELEFEPASTLSLTGSLYRSTNATDIGGTVTIGAGTSALRNGGTTVFEGTSSTTLTGDLRLDNPSRINAGATFSGGGTLVNVVNRTLTLADGADVDVVLQNDGTLVLGASAGQTLGLGFQQTEDGAWDVELGGTGLNDFDRMNLTGAALLDGTLELALINGYVPNFGDTLDILSATGGVTETFASVQQPATMPAWLEFDLVYSPTLVQLVVVPRLLGDYNQNGVVDAADYTVWRDTYGALAIEFSGADGDGNGTIDAGDYDVWRAHFGETAGGGSGQVTGAAPEPTCLVLAFLACGAPLIDERRRRSQWRS
jgi:hypothetical protein